MKASIIASTLALASTLPLVFAGALLPQAQDAPTTISRRETTWEAYHQTNSLQNVSPGGANINCIVNKADGSFLGNINNQATFLDLDGVADKAVETDVSAFTIKCNPQ